MTEQHKYERHEGQVLPEDAQIQPAHQRGQEPQWQPGYAGQAVAFMFVAFERLPGSRHFIVDKLLAVCCWCC